MLPGESHDEFLELCALSTTSLLSAQERRRLEEHLRDCSQCHEIHAQYLALVDCGIPAAIAHEGRESSRDPASVWSVDEAEKALFARLEREESQRSEYSEDSAPVPSSDEPSPPSEAEPPPDVRREPIDPLWRQLWWQYAAAALLVASLVVWFYRSGVRRGTEIAGRAVGRASATARDSGADKYAAQQQALVASIRQEKIEVAALRAQLESKSAEIARLQGEKALLDQSVHAVGKDRDDLTQKAQELTQQLASREADLASMRERMAGLGGQDAQDQVRLTALERQIGDLKTSLDQKDEEIAREQELLEHDRDIRELMGSRDLYIAEVYDVAKNGETRKPFGRVFYTRGKSLIFYAYDLDQQPGIRKTSSFQAWGLRGPDQAVNLGILYVDSAAKQRWVLKADNPRTLQDIDAVFVTVEPHGGSQKPTGKRLLFSYLKVEPNHP